MVSNEPLRWQGNTIDWEVRSDGKYLVAEGWYRDKLVSTLKARAGWVLMLRIAVAHVWHLAVSR